MAQNILCADIGGTNANFSIVSPEFDIKVIKHYATKDAARFSILINRFLAESGKYKLKEACIAVAGPVEDVRGRKFARMTNSSLIVDENDILKKTSITKVKIINDFEAISYAVNIVTSKDLHVLNRGKPSKNAQMAVVGAGTGLGTSIMRYDEKRKDYVPVASEGGHIEIAAADTEERMLIEHLKKKHGGIEYESLVSGPGLENMYEFYSEHYPGLPRKLGAMEISTTRHQNMCAKRTYATFLKFYARFCRNYALTAISEGGLYIAGGIAAKNCEAFSAGFLEEFFNHPREQYRQILMKMPVYIIKNYDIGHLGCAYHYMR